jgi:hypothetical protein
MNRTRRQLARLTALAATILGLVLVTAAQASAMRPEPGPTGPGSVSQPPGTPSVLHVSENSVSVLQWVLFAAAVIGALLIGAAMMQVSQRRRARLAH